MASFWSALLLALLAVETVVHNTEAYRVLGVFPFNGRSHNIMLKAMMEVLADRGHEVVVLSPFPQKKPRANYTDLDLSREFPSLVNMLDYEQMTSANEFTILKTIQKYAGADICRTTFETQHFRDIMDGKHGKFDVVFTEVFGSDCWTAVAYKLDLPLISISTGVDFAWIHERVGSVDNPSYLTVAFRPLAGKMNFWQRVGNTFMYVAAKYLFKQYVDVPSDVVVKEFFGPDTPSIEELVKRTSLVMDNSHVSVNPARPINPNVINVGGLHLKDFEPDRTGARLDPDLRRWMDGAEHGVIFFSLGSMVRANSLPKEAIQGLIQAFAAIPQRVLWKYESDDIADQLSPNVRIASWMPQTDVLAHPKTILFITHCGLMGTNEALLLGVPMLGIPLFADQFPNSLQYKLLGIAERIDHFAITKDTVLAEIKKMTSTNAYRARAKMIADRYLDRPRSAADEAAWWTEYVIRHRGAPHLRPLGADMPLYQYLLLDVVALAAGILIAALLLLRTVFRLLLGLVTSPPRSNSNASAEKKKKKQ